MAPLEEYRAKRDFAATPEPSGEGAGVGSGALTYVIQEHAATAHHYDFRLELDGVLLSWAVPKGPSYDPHDKRLAVRTEDHPLDYAGFEGAIPEPEYGAGTVLVWDRGTWEPFGDAHAGLEKGDFKFDLRGEKLHGRWVLVRMKPRGNDKRENWLLIKERDEFAVDGGEPIEKAEPRSVLSGRTLDQVRDEEAEASSQSDRPPSAAATGREPGAPQASDAQPPEPSVDASAGAVEAPMPREVAPELARLVARAPDGPGWISEVKYDGYRALVFLENGRARAVTRSGADWSDKFAPIVKAAEQLPAASAVLDGEVVVFDEDGMSRFQLLQDALGRAPEKLAFPCFDLLYLNGYDLRGMPLIKRKELLRELLQRGPQDGPLRYTEHVTDQAVRFHERACDLGLEGSVVKRADARYLGKREGAWLKVKCRAEQEFVVGGFTDPGGAREGFGALLVGYYRGDDLVYAGRVGTGFSDARLKQLSAQLKRIERKSAPFVDPPKLPSAHWVTPSLVVEVAFHEWTRDGNLRQPAFMGVREDKDPHEVTREMPTENAQAPVGEPGDASPELDAPVVLGVKLTNPDKRLLPESDVTKVELARYYEQVASVMMPHVEERPLTLVRCPVGKGQDCFYQRHPDAGLPKQVRTLAFGMPGSEPEEWLYVDEPAGLVALAQMGVTEVHTWQSRCDTIDRPDRLVFDLDPGPEVAWSQIRQAALILRDTLEALEFDVFVKTTGGKGLHVVVPLEPVYDYERLRPFAKRIVDALVIEHPDLLHGRMAKAERTGKVFVDYLRNALGASAVAPYSTRARAGGPVSVPISWDELTDDLDPKRFTVASVLDRVAAGTDPWAGIFERQASSRTLRAALSAKS